MHLTLNCALYRFYIASRYYPTRIGEIIKEQYQVVGKLGFGSTSTAWLARDMNILIYDNYSGHRYVMLKIFVQASFMGQLVDDELKIYRHMEQSPKGHPGRDAHRRLVHPPLWDSVLTFLRRNPVERLPSAIVAFVLRRLFLALDYLHTECQIIYIDIKADNIMLGINDDSVFSDFEEKELQRPVPRKEVDMNGRTIYMSRDLRMPNDLGAPVLCDFGSAVLGNQNHTEFIQPNIYRAPEEILGVPWTYSVDIWNIWDIYEGGSLFTDQDPEFQTYRSRAHLADMINLLGPPPPSLLTQGELRDIFFLEEGTSSFL
ncbi:kinase-like domain-containing protein [Penicillium cinerascens]|uniref:Kinase-like domain-containing protein n=1 Tax=Penicillium cinerascens TaxID=70096 RepID=A0A9W9MIL1_9EURO|nr:kinase-like domain-containing protein [Penicillium cinerascens]KAJ5201990.1 kinase-like domain-containing protein [Penicillium cinerascens]